ncbi:iron-containing alcohol dehydrogenase [Clostridium fermenticellae]|nr:iron-containing alcohol dehydrogenase [Clostridium fermenticellae]
MDKFAFGQNYIVMGENALQYLNNIDTGKTFILIGAESLIKNCILKKVKNILKIKKFPVCTFSGITREFEINTMNEILDIMKRFKPDTIVALGGGSVMDAAKILILAYEGPDIDFDKLSSICVPSNRKYLKFITIPSILGTGSGVNGNVLMSLKYNEARVKFKNSFFAPDIVILDPLTSINVPPNIVAQSGILAMVHALQCYMDDNLNDISRCLALSSIKGIFRYLPLSFKSNDMKFREKLQNYECISGLAFNDVHNELIDAVTSSISSKFKLSYSEVNAIIFPYFLEYSSRNIKIVSKLKVLSKYLKIEDFINFIRKFSTEFNIKRSLKEIGVDESVFKNNLFMLVQDSAKYFTRVKSSKIAEEDIVRILKYVYYGHDIDF